MQRTTTFSAALLGLCSVAAAQTGGNGGQLLGAAPRPEVQLSTGLVTTSTNSFRNWHIRSPKQPNVPDAAAGIVDNRRVVYATWNDINRSRNLVAKFARSVDGGWSWPVQTVDVFEADGAAGESFENPDVQLNTIGDTVAFVLTSNRRPDGTVHPNDHDYVWLCASADQGQTWQNLCVNKDAPLASGDLLGDCDEPFLAVDADGIFHIVFEADYGEPDPNNPGQPVRPGFAVGVGDASTQEDVYYVRAAFDQNGTLALLDAEERNLESTPTGLIDTDTCRVFTDAHRLTDGPAGSNVMFVYRNNSEELAQTGAYTGAGIWNGTYTRVSNDGGATLSAEVLHNPAGTLPVTFSTRESKGVVRGDTMVVTMEDSRPVGGNNLDRIWGSISTDGGANWTFGLLLSNEPNDPGTMLPVDIDNHHISAAGDTIVLAYCHDFGDNGGGVGNTDNDTYAVVEANGGADWLAGAGPAEQLVIDTPTNNSVFASNVDMIFDADGMEGTGAPAVIAISSETSSFPEDCGYAFSLDGGATWQWYEALQFQSGDTDDVFVAVTLNGDINVIWQDDDNGGNGNNNVYTRGGKVIEGYLDTVNGRTTPAARFPIASELSQNDLCFFMPSLTPPISNGAVVNFNGNPYTANFVFDGLSLGAIGSVGFFLGFFDANGVATTSLPNFASLLQAPIYWTALPFAVNGGPDNALRFLSDPFIQNP